MSTRNWQRVLDDILDAVTLEDDTFTLDLRTAKDPNGVHLKDLLPQEAMCMDGDDLDAWWTDSGAPQSDVWMRHGWVVLRAHSDTMTVAFARVYGEQQGRE